MKQPEILYEDTEVILCHKPAGIATQTRRIGQQDMENILRNHRARNGEPSYIGVVHRLDQPVEGAMVFAKTERCAAELSRQVRERSIGKYYYALVQLPDTNTSFTCFTGLPKQGQLCDFLSFDRKNNVSHVVSASHADAKKAVLSYNVYSEHNGCALLDIELQTGRHHQIRTQLSHIHTPIVGDTKYAGKSMKSSGGLALCSYRICFKHPVTGKKMDYTIKPCNPIFDSFLL